MPMNDRRSVTLLLKVFPVLWRAEYGLELSSLLESKSLTPAIVWNVFRSGLHERLRTCPAWAKASLFLACWFVAGLAANSARAMSAESYNLFWSSYLPLEFSCGYCLKRRGSRSPGRHTAYAVLLGSLPMMAIEWLRKLHVVDPTILDLQGNICRLGNGFTEFAYRGVASHDDLYSVVAVMIFGAILASITGWLGGRIAQAVETFQRARSER